MAKLLVGKDGQDTKAPLDSEHETGVSWSGFLSFGGEYSEFLLR